MKNDTPTPIFNADTAKPCEPTRHEPTARTFCFRQPSGSNVHLFSATRVFVATVRGREPKPEPAPDAPIPPAS